MNLSISVDELKRYLKSQIDNFFPDFKAHGQINHVVELALQRLEFNFSHVALNHYYKNGSIYFNHLNSDQYAVFLYYASNIAYEIYEDVVLAEKLFYLNKTLNSFHCMYYTKLPDKFLLIHGIGIVLGKAKYSDYLVLSQNCNIGANADLVYPVIDQGVILYPNSSVIGNSYINKNVCISNGVFVNNTSIPQNSLVFGRSPDLTIKKDTKRRLGYFFKVEENAQ